MIKFIKSGSKVRIGCNDILGIIQVLVRRYNPFMFFVDQYGLPDGHIRIGEINSFLPFLGHGHPADDNIESAEVERRDNAGPCRVERNEFYAQGFGHLPGNIDVKAD